MNGILVGRVRGIAIRLNWSVAVVAVLITWSLADVVFPDLAEGRSTSAYWVAGAVTSALFLAALAAHEISHAVVALREDVRVRSITLWLFGGVAELETKPPTAPAAFRIAAAGPAMSGLIGVACLGVALLTDGLVQAAIGWLGVMNLILMVFNLLPAFPLDGGRIYHAWLWNRDGDEMRATTRAAEVGTTIGAVLVGIGVVQLLLGALVGGVWMMAIGWFLREAARAEWQGAALEQPLATMTVAEVMSRNPVTVPGDTAVQTFVDNLLYGGRHAAYPITGDGGAVIGLLSIGEIRRALGGPGLAGPTVADVAVPIADVVTTTPATSVGELLRELTGRPDGRALVLDDDGELVGIVSPSDVARLVSVIELRALDRLARQPH